MNITDRSVRASSVLAALLTAAMALHAQADTTGAARLETLRQTPDVAGAAVYSSSLTYVPVCAGAIQHQLWL